MSQKRKSIQFNLNHWYQIKSGNNEKRFGMQSKDNNNNKRSKYGIVTVTAPAEAKA